MNGHTKVCGKRTEDMPLLTVSQSGVHNKCPQTKKWNVPGCDKYYDNPQEMCSNKANCDWWRPGRKDLFVSKNLKKAWSIYNPQSLPQKPESHVTLGMFFPPEPRENTPPGPREGIDWFESIPFAILVMSFQHEGLKPNWALPSDFKECRVSSALPFPTFSVIWGRLRDLGSSEPNRCKPNQSTSQAVSSKSICTAVWWSRWGLIWDLSGSSGLFSVGDTAQGRNLSNIIFFDSGGQKGLWKCGKNGVWM